MSGRVSLRVSRLEKHVRAAGVCKLCGGHTQLKVIIGDEKPAPGPCLRCGREPTVVRIIRGIPPEGWEGRDKAQQAADSP